MEMGTEIARHTFPLVFSIATHHPQDTTCLRSLNPHLWSHISCKHNCVWSRRQVTQPHNTLGVLTDPGSTCYRPLPHLIPCQWLPPSHPPSGFPISGNPNPHGYVQDTRCHITSTPDNTEHGRATSQVHNGSTKRGWWKRLVRENEEIGEAKEHEHVAEQVETPQGEYTPPILTPSGQHNKHDNEVNAGEIAHAECPAVKLPANNPVMASEAAAATLLPSPCTSQATPVCSIPPLPLLSTTGSPMNTNQRQRDRSLSGPGHTTRDRQQQ
jgi:hypothetical protein